MQAICELCGQVWCGRPCMNDPHKSNGLLFWPDGRRKTLKERGLGWDDPPVKAAPPPVRSKPVPVPKLKELVRAVSVKTASKSNKRQPESNAESNKPKPESNASKQRFDRAAYQRELMRKRRAEKAEAKRKTTTQDFKG
jgi:hypothetical protein